MQQRSHGQRREPSGCCITWILDQASSRIAALSASNFGVTLLLLVRGDQPFHLGHARSQAHEHRFGNEEVADVQFHDLRYCRYVPHVIESQSVPRMAFDAQVAGRGRGKCQPSKFVAALAS